MSRVDDSTWNAYGQSINEGTAALASRSALLGPGNSRLNRRYQKLCRRSSKEESRTHRIAALLFIGDSVVLWRTRSIDLCFRRVPLRQYAISDVQAGCWNKQQNSRGRHARAQAANLCWTRCCTARDEMISRQPLFLIVHSIHGSYSPPDRKDILEL